MNGNEFERMIRKLGRERGVAVPFEERPGKGSHGAALLWDQLHDIKRSPEGNWARLADRDAKAARTAKT